MPSSPRVPSSLFIERFKMTNNFLVEPLGSCQLFLPSALYVVPGQEINIYFDNIVLAAMPARYLFDVTCEKGAQHAKRWFWSPDNEPGAYPLQIEVRGLDDEVLATGCTTIQVVHPEAGRNRDLQLLCIGDSLTAASIYTGELLKLCKGPGNPNLTLLGTQVSDPAHPENRNEGYGGWRYESFTKKWEDHVAPDAPPSSGCSPFLFLENGMPRLDIARYIDEKLHGAIPSFVLFNLGINDVFLATDQTRRPVVENMIENSQTLVSAVRTALPNATLGIVIPVPPSTSQDSFGETNGNLQTRWGYRKNLLLAQTRLAQTFGGREEENIHLVWPHPNLDCENNYPTVERIVNARSEIKVQLNNNEVHPAPSGYFQIADSIYAWIKSQLEKTDNENNETELATKLTHNGNGHPVFVGTGTIYESSVR